MNMVLYHDTLFGDINYQVRKMCFFFLNLANSLNFNYFFCIAGVNPNDISSTLSSDGVLTVTTPLKPQLPQNTEKIVPIQQTGPAKTHQIDSATGVVTSPKIE